MKKLYFLFVAALFVGLYSCKKTDNNSTLPDVTGRWSLVSDSTSLSGSGSATTHVYKGAGTDYYNFSNNGMLYINNAGRKGLDTATYSVIAINQLSIYYMIKGVKTGYASGNGTFTINTFTSHSLKISTVGLTPDGILSTYFTLSR